MTYGLSCKDREKDSFFQFQIIHFELFSLFLNPFNTNRRGGHAGTDDMYRDDDDRNRWITLFNLFFQVCRVLYLCVIPYRLENLNELEREKILSERAEKVFLILEFEITDNMMIRVPLGGSI